MQVHIFLIAFKKKIIKKIKWSDVFLFFNLKNTWKIAVPESYYDYEFVAAAAWFTVSFCGLEGEVFTAV